MKMLLASVIVVLSCVSHAALFDRGGGMIYDDVLNITWLQDANLGGSMTPNEAVAWADALEFGGYDDWRLPSMDVNGDHIDTGTGEFNVGIVYCDTESEMACRDNELGYMFYHNLMGNLFDQLSGDQGLFTNIQPSHWSSTESAIYQDVDWGFTFDNGFNFIDGMNPSLGAWAVRDGDVAPVPLPGAVWLMASGLLGLAGLRRAERWR